MDNDQSITKQPRKAASALAGSYVLAGLALALFANILLNFVQPLKKVDPESLPAAHTWVWWATHEYLAQPSAPDVVVLGSSLVMHPVSRLDADHLGRDLDYVHHHRSEYIGANLANTLGLPAVNCFNYSLPGGMVSDDYIVTRAMLTDPRRKPKVLVIGLSLRDFIDNGVRCAGATPAFRYLKRFCDTDDVIELAMPQIWQRFDYFVGKGVYLWGKKLDLQVFLGQQVKTAVVPIMASFSRPCRLAEVDLSKNMPSNLRSEVEEGMFIVKSHQPYSWEDNSGEYKKRYRSPNEKLFDIQNKFLDRLIELARKEGIKVVLVNMPLTPNNMKLMPAGSYSRYTQALTDASARFGVKYIDLNGDGSFSDQDFYDTSHMNAGGGKKLADRLIDAIGGETELRAALAPSSRPSRLFAQRRQPDSL